MPGSTKTSVESSVYVSRTGPDITFAFGQDVTIQDVIAAAKRLEAGQVAQAPASPTPAAKPTSPGMGYKALRDILNEGVQIGDLRAAALQLAQAREARQEPKRAAAFDLTRSLSPAAADTPEVDAAWEEMPTRGPADLIRYFAVAALYEHQPELRSFDDASYAVILDAVEFAVGVAVRLAGVSENWIDEYRALTAYLHE